MRRIHLLALALLVGCAPPEEEQNQGIAVGNPGVVSMSMAEAAGFTFTLVQAPIDALGWASCGAGDALDELATTLDLVDEPEPLPFPAGTWCGVVVRFAGPLELKATWEEGGATATLTAAVDLPDVLLGAIDGDLIVDEGTAWALELASPDWLDAGALGLADGVDLVIEVADPGHALLVAAFTDETALFHDADASGLVETEERDAGPAALPMQFAFNPDPAPGATADAAGYSGGCTSGGPGSGGWTWALLSLLVLAQRRRRSGSAQPRPPRLQMATPGPPSGSCTTPSSRQLTP